MKIKDDAINLKLFSSKGENHLDFVEKRPTLNTGIMKIDSLFGFPSGYYVILGNPGTGKSWFALWLSRVFYRINMIKSVYFTLEMPESVVKNRILQQWSDLTKNKFENGGSTEEAKQLMLKDVIVVDDFYTDDTKFQTPNSFELWIDKYYELGYRSFHFDHLHEIMGANDNKSNQTITELWAKTFQKICKKYKDIWLFVYAQPNGAAASKKILTRTDIAGSKAIMQKCDYVLSLNKKFEIDKETGLLTSESDDRAIILYIDKTRYTENCHVGFGLYFGFTGNFLSGDEA